MKRPSPLRSSSAPPSLSDEEWRTVRDIRQVLTGVKGMLAPYGASAENWDSLIACFDRVVSLANEVRAPNAERSASREDKARLDWLEMNPHGAVCNHRGFWTAADYDGRASNHRGRTLREAIDAARSSAAGSRPGDEQP